MQLAAKAQAMIEPKWTHRKSTCLDIARRQPYLVHHTGLREAGRASGSGTPRELHKAAFGRV